MPMLWFLQPGVTLETVFMRVLSVLVIILLVLPLHECAHAWVAYRMGDSTAKNRGRLTLNPLPSIDPIGALCILLFGFGWTLLFVVKPLFHALSTAGVVLVILGGAALGPTGWCCGKKRS